MTYADLIIAALARSAKNDPDILATHESELLEAAHRAVAGAYAVAARVNPEYVGVAVPVDELPAGSWARPQGGTIFGITDAAGREVVAVPYHDQQAEPSKPAVYLMGARYHAVQGGANAPAGALTFYLAEQPAAPATLDDALPASWPVAHTDLLVADLALYLAVKDGRMEEVGALEVERQAALGRFVSFLAYENVITRRRYGQVRRVATSELLPLLAGSVAGMAGMAGGAA